jgi:hypothetical protein
MSEKKMGSIIILAQAAHHTPTLIVKQRQFVHDFGVISRILSDTLDIYDNI